MKKKLIKVALVGKTNAGKSTLVNSFVGEKISIVNKIQIKMQITDANNLFKISKIKNNKIPPIII